MRTFTILIPCLLAFALTLGGCFSKQETASTGNTVPEADLALTSHNPISLLNYRQARVYAAQGRYELAREHFLLAYAAAEGDGALRGMLQREIKGVDMMLRTIR